MNIGKLLTRAISGLIYCLIVIGLILWGNIGVDILSILFAVLACVEFTKICKEFNSTTMPVVIIDVAGCVALCFGYLVYPLFIWGALMICRMIEQLYIKSRQPVKDLTHSMFCQIYIGMPLGLMSAIGHFYCAKILLALFFIIWINDTGAFLVGSLIGKHKLFERISPKKTWEGFLGGVAFSLVLSLIFNCCCNSFFGTEEFGFGLAEWLGFGAIVSIFGTWGDLIESMIKRNLNIKDSGNLIPGHGGILDRIDSLLFTLPAIVLYLIVVAKWSMLEILIGI